MPLGLNKGQFYGHARALSGFPAESPGKEMDSNQEDMLVALRSIEEQESDPQTKSAKSYGREEWALIQQKDPDLMQLLCFLSQKHKPTSPGC